MLKEKCKILNSFRKYKKGQQIEEKYYILENLLVASIEDVYSCPDTWYFKSPCPKFCKAVTIFLVIFFFFNSHRKKTKNMTLEFFNEKFTLILKHGKFFCLSLFCNFLHTFFFFFFLNSDIQIANELSMQFKIIRYKFNQLSIDESLLIHLLYAFNICHMYKSH